MKMLIQFGELRWNALLGNKTNCLPEAMILI